MTTTTTTTVVILATFQTAITYSLIGTVALFMALIIKELATHREGPEPTVMERVKALSKNMVVAIIPLAMTFIFAVVLKAAEIIQA